MATAFSSALNTGPQAISTSRSSRSWEPSTTHADEYTPDVDNEGNTEYFPTANGHANGHAHPPQPMFPPRTSSLSHQSSTSDPDPKRSPFALGIRASLLSIGLGTSISLLIYLLFIHPSTQWRIPFFAYLLCQFHLLEYHITALYNPDAATTSAFLLNNGRAYNIAHLLAFVECTAHWALTPPGTSKSPLSLVLTPLPLPFSSPFYLAIGILLTSVGQILRTLAMARAGTNFTHLVQSHKRDGHVLVTDGVYKYLRHPSYCGFFWWGLGGQIVLGNTWCLVGFTLVLWRFFRARIAKEEFLLVGFFANEYERYRDRTWVGIPFIR